MTLSIDLKKYLKKLEKISEYCIIKVFYSKKFISKKVFFMNFYSNKAINLLSLTLTIIVYLFLTLYIPNLYFTVKNYVYYKIQPTNLQDY